MALFRHHIFNLWLLDILFIEQPSAGFVSYDTHHARAHTETHTPHFRRAPSIQELRKVGYCCAVCVESLAG